MGTRRRKLVVVGAVTAAAVIGMSLAAATTASRDGQRVAFYGDSYTLGTGATDYSKRWSTIICENRRWIEFNPSTNGLGFVNQRGFPGSRDLVPVIIAENPDIVFITMGLNDNFSFELRGPEIEQAIAADFAALTEALPTARFVVVEPFWYTDDRPASVDVIIGWVRAAAAEIDADYIAGASHWIEGHPEWMAGDGLHPNDAGYAEMASRMDAELAKIGL